MPSKDDPIEQLRREIDRIDDAMHDLLMERVATVQKIGRVKDRNTVPIFRPGREATILRRLIGRHKGALPAESLVRIWREIIAASVRLEGKFAVAAYAPEGEPVYIDLARDHFGALTPITEYGSAGQVIAAVTRSASTVGVLPLPEDAGEDAWWRNLAGGDGKGPRIVARLPFVGHRPGRSRSLDALVVGRIAAEATERDRSYVLLETEGEVSRASLKTMLEQAGFESQMIETRAAAAGAKAWVHLIEVEGFVADGDSRLPEFVAKLGPGVIRTEILGTCAVPLSEAELASANGK